MVYPQVYAGFWDTKPKAKAPAKIIPVKTVPVSNAANKKIEARVKESLASKDWMIYLAPVEGKNAVTDMDVLIFSEGRFTSKNLFNKGYPRSNFTIVVSDNGRVDWEVVQTAGNGDMAAWKGRLEADVMSGILSMHTVKGKIEDFYFTNVTSQQ